MSEYNQPVASPIALESQRACKLQGDELQRDGRGTFIAGSGFS